MKFEYSRFQGLGYLLLVISLPVFLLSSFGAPYPAPIGLLSSCVFLWVTNLVPPAVTGMMVPCLAIVFGILTPSSAFAPFGSGILALFVGVFLLVRGFQKYGLDQRIAMVVLQSKFATVSPGRLVLVTAISAWLLGMWMSNTATCAVFLPICLSILDWAKKHLTKSQYQSFSARLLLTCAYTPSIGGMTTPVGSAPNALAIDYLSKHGRTIGFFEWFWIALPISVTLLVASLLVLHFLFPLGGKFTAKEVESHVGHVHRRQHRVLFAVFVLVVLFWLAPDIGGVLGPRFELAHRLPLAVPALLGAALLFVIKVDDSPILDSSDLPKIEWNAILIFGGGLCLGEVLGQSGAAASLANSFISDSRDSVGWLPLIVPVVSTFLSEISSNTTTASIMVPVLGNIFQVMPSQDSLTLIFSSVFAAGLGFMLPISTPPNALVFGTGRIKLAHMMAAGLLLDLVGIFAIAVYGFLRIG